MSKKKVLIALAVATALTVPFSVFAATSTTSTAIKVRNFFGIDATKLTDKQKEDVKTYSQKMADLQKDFINKMVENGSMTKEQGEAATKKVDEAIKNGAENGYIPGFGMGKGGHGRGGGFGIGRIDASKLTDAQKADIKATHTKMINLQKDLISKAVSKGIITKAQGDSAAARIDELAKNTENDAFIGGFMMGKGGFGLFGFGGVDNSKLTDDQKAVFTEYSNSMTELRKELVNKLVAAGVMTKEQGDAVIQGIGNLKDFTGKDGFIDGKGMRKGGSGGKGRFIRPNTSTTTSSAIQ